MKLVTLDEAKNNLLIEPALTAFDTDINLKITIASDMIINHIKNRNKLYQPLYAEDGSEELDSNGDPVYELDSNGDLIIRPLVKGATLVMVGILFRDRDGAEANKWSRGYLPDPVTSILCSLRDPTLA